MKRNFLTRMVANYRYRYSVVSSIQRLDLRSSKIGFSGSLFLFASMTFVDILFALSLQRFLSSVGLIEQVSATRLFGNIRSDVFEALTLLGIAALRSILILINNSLFIFTISNLQYSSKTKLLSIDFSSRSRKQRKQSFQYFFYDVCNNIGEWLGTFYQLLGRCLVTFVLTMALCYYSVNLAIGIIIILSLIFPLQKKLNDEIRASSTQIHRQNSKVSDLLSLQAERKLEKVKIDSRLRKSVLFELEAIRHQRRRITIFSSIRNQFPTFLGVLIVIGIAHFKDLLFIDSSSEVVPFIYLFLRCSQSLVDVFRLSSYLRIEWPRIESFVRIHERLN